MKRKLAWVCLLVSPLVLGGAAFCLSNRDPITLANCDKIKKGMTEKEVESILGREKDGEWASWFGPPIYYWRGSRGTVMVEMNFGDPTFLETARFSASEPRTMFEKIRNWLGL